MSDIGGTLRNAREELNISLAEAEAATRIRARFLQALEENHFDSLPGEAAVRGFLRNYASYLGLDPLPLLEQLGGEVEPVLPATRSTTTQPRLMSEPLQNNPVPFGRIFLVLGVLALIGVAALSLWWQPEQRDALLARMGLPELGFAVATPSATPNVSPAAAPSLTAQRTVVTQTLIIIEPNGDATAVPTATLPPRTPTPDPNATPTLAPTATPPPAQQGIVLAAEVVERTWAEVRVDSQSEPLVQRILEPGETFEWAGEQELFIRLGNAAGLRLTLNGQDLGTLGGSGEVLERLWQTNPDGGPPVVVTPNQGG